MKILLIGGEPGDRAASALESATMLVECVPSLAEGEEMLKLYTFDAVLLATNVDVEAKITKLRKVGCKVPLLVLSSVSDSDAKAATIEAGADDYVVDPFYVREFVARIHAVARRQFGQTSSEICAGELVINPRKTGFVFVKGKEVKLSPKTFALLQMFMRRPGVVFSRQEILDNVWGTTHIDERGIDVQMGRLRSLLKAETGGVDYFQTVRGTGYMFSIPKK